MIRSLESVAELEYAFEDDAEPGFVRIETRKNRSMPVRSHCATNNGRRRFGSRRPSSRVGIQRRFNKKVLHN
jgi:hypothetical protein